MPFHAAHLAHGSMLMMFSGQAPGAVFKFLLTCVRQKIFRDREMVQGLALCSAPEFPECFDTRISEEVCLTLHYC